MVEVKTKGPVNLESKLPITKEQEAKIKSHPAEVNHLMEDLHINHTICTQNEKPMSIVGRQYEGDPLNINTFQSEVYKLSADHKEFLKAIDDLAVPALDVPADETEQILSDEEKEEMLQHERAVESLEKAAREFREEAAKNEMFCGICLLHDGVMQYFGNIPAEVLAIGIMNRLIYGET